MRKFLRLKKIYISYITDRNTYVILSTFVFMYVFFTPGVKQVKPVRRLILILDGSLEYNVHLRNDVDHLNC